MISFIVPAYNEEAELPGTLRAIHYAAIGYEYEILLVNDGSTDATAAIGEQCGARVISIERRQIAAARNAGAKAARGAVFIFVDADTRIGPEHARGAIDALENGFAGGGSRLAFDEIYFAGEEVFFTVALKRLGRFKLLREAAITSGRKLRMYSGWKVFGGLFAVLFGGPRGVMSRKKLDMWYGGEREKPIS